MPQPDERPPGTVIRSKLTVPPLADRLVPRSRVADLLADLVEGHCLVWVTATAGAGKTTAVVQTVQLLARPVAWLTVDRTDTAPGRLLIYLEEAIAEHVPEARGIVGAALAARIPHAEAAGLLVEAIGPTPLLVVLDGLEQIAGDDGADARAVVGSLVRYAPSTARVVLLSRVDVPLDLGTAGGPDRVAAVGEATLAFTPLEAEQALAGAGRTGIDPARAVEVTGGWVTGVLFEAWRSREHVAGAGGEADPLHGYLASQILGRLPPENQDFLVATSLLDEVTAARAAALGQHRPGERLVELRTQHLPVSWSAASERMRCHPRFREYLLTRLQRRDDAQVWALRRRHGELLRAEGHLEEAVEEFLSADETEMATAAAEDAIGTVIDRLDFAVAERWLGALAQPDRPGRRRLAGAELMLAIAREDYRRGGLIADRLHERGARDELARDSATAAAAMTWCYWHLGRVEDAQAVMGLAEQCPEIDAVSYLMSLVGGSPGRRTPSVQEFSGGPMDALVMRVHYAHGQLQEVVPHPASPWAAAISAPWRVGALRATGRLTEALELYRAADAGGWSPAWMHGMVGAELMIDLRRTDEARAVLARGRGLILASGSVVFGWLNSLIEAKLELRLAGDPAAALAILDEVAAGGGGRYAFIREAIDTWRAMALLLQRRPPQEAVGLLRRAVRSMDAADRILDLPTAAVYLAEALWRAEDPDGADEAADRALAAAVRQGSNHQLLLAAADFPGVVSRRLDAEVASDSAWHDIGRALRSQPVRVDLEARTVLRLSEFGHAALAVDGREVKPRIAKSLTLLAFLAATSGHRATREQLLEALFDGRDDPSTRAYLRQAVHRLRELLPEGVGPAFTDGVLGFTAPVRVDADSGRMEALLAEAARLQGEARLSVLLRALECAAAGPYLPGVESAWAQERRQALNAEIGEARLAAAQLAFAAEGFGQAEELVERVLADDPYKESAWRLAMRIASALGDEDRVIATFHRCRESLQELDLVPSDATSSLLVQLRR
ncbi:transcriptional activator domain protein [Geodermatophilus sp. TF02-6]|uniref:BTAD domain-containing putative transcriptional regulator n=1 Tax=Geodermatophilus sp. TF02-6 TaxID=2250575 RepID=UPI000DE94EDC|nr:BTAD domain-containing putative transcriptional regulator [Geodermatophilus sp. TF02-6]RBY78772.1 transcriptional activator domain protein [Geodermatophilus sp. TF02-6]